MACLHAGSLFIYFFLAQPPVTQGKWISGLSQLDLPLLRNPLHPCDSPVPPRSWGTVPRPGFLQCAAWRWVSTSATQWAADGASPSPLSPRLLGTLFGDGLRSRWEQDPGPASGLQPWADQLKCPPPLCALPTTRCTCWVSPLSLLNFTFSFSVHCSSCLCHSFS